MNKKPFFLSQIINFIKKRSTIISKTEKIDLLSALDRILAENIYSKIDLPPFKNSAVDGYALLKEDLNSKHKNIGKNRLAAGDKEIQKIKHGECHQIQIQL